MCESRAAIIIGENMQNYLKKATKIFDAYCKFAYERQNIFFKRLAGVEEPWTDDAILQKYKFTNCYRITDRVSQYLVKNVIYNDKIYTPEDTFFRIILFKLFNKIDTWIELEKNLGEIAYKSYKRENYEKVFEHLLIRKEKLYSAAYIMPSGTSYGYDKKYKNNLSLLENMMNNKVPAQIARAKSLKEVYELLISYDTIGSFLAFQYAIDINYSELCDFSEMSYVVAGPGAKRGISKCFDLAKPNYEEIIRFVAENQDIIMEKYDLNFHKLYDRPLQLIDCQNIFCEIDKYSRVAFPDLNTTECNRIKQKFTANNNKIEYFFPPKWNLFN